MKKVGYIIGILFLASMQIWASDCSFNPIHENVLSIKYGGIWQQDQYLSPLLYSGQQVGLSNEWWQEFQCDSVKHWEHVGKMDIGFVWMYNNMYSNLIY